MTSEAEPANLRRKTMIDIVRRRQQPGSGSQPGLRRERQLLNWPDLRPILEGILWAVVGGVATRQYMPERATGDLDIAILARDAGTAAAKLSRAGYTPMGAIVIGGSTWRSPDGIDVDVIELVDTWADALLDATRNLDVQGLPVLPLGYLVIRKLRASRFQDVGDVGRMLEHADEAELEKVQRIVDRLEPYLSEDVVSMIEIARWRREQEPRI